MSSSAPGPTDPAAPEPAGTPEVEYLGDRERSGDRSGRRTGLVVAGTVAAVAAAGAGAWAVTQFLDSGPAPATAVPSDAFGYVALDLDPDGGQKIEAIQTLRKFPAVREELGIDSGDDLRRVLYEAITVDDPCPAIDYDDDIAPWLGAKVAIAAVPGDDDVVPFLVVQVEDQELAVDGVGKIAACAHEDAPGTAFVGGFMIVAETADLADRIAADAERSPLTDDTDFGRWIDEAGGSGIIEAYVSAEAPRYLAEEAEQAPMGGTPQLQEAFEEFEGAAMVVRFDDEALEVEVAAGGPPSQVSTGGDSGMTDLPASSAVALGFGVADDMVQQMIDSFAETSGLGQDGIDGLLAQAEAQTGLVLPEDLQALLGDGLSVTVDSSADFGAVVDGSQQPADLPAGIRIVGDPAEIAEALDKVLDRIGPVAQGVVVEEGDGVVAVALDQEYAETLAGNGGLGEEARFERALEDLDETAGAFYVDFDAGDWLTELAATDPDERIQENVAPLDSLGVSGSVEDDVVHGIVRLTTD